MMFGRILIFQLLLALAGSPLLPGQETTSADPYKKWIDEDVAYIVTPEEQAVFQKLSTPEEKESFIEQFWLRRDPTPGTAANEFKEEHYRRLAYVRENFTAGIPGWRTDRGRIYIIHGPPDGIESHPGGAYLRPASEGGGQTSTFPFEKWWYRHIDGIGDGIEIEFVDDKGGGQFEITRDPNRKDAFLYAPNAGLTDLEAVGAVKKLDRILGRSTEGPGRGMDTYTRAQDQPLEKLLTISRLNRPPALRFKDLAESVSARISYNALPFQFITETFHISSSDALVPLAIQLRNEDVSYEAGPGIRQSRVNLYGRVSTLAGNIVGEFEDTIQDTVPEGDFSRAQQAYSLYQRPLILQPGLYKLSLALKDSLSEKMGSVEARLEVPAFPDSEPALSSILLADRIDAVTESDTIDNYVFGTTRVIPRVNRQYRTSESLGVYFQVYNFPVDAATGAPRALLEYAVVPADSPEDAAWHDITVFARPSGNKRVFARLLQLKDFTPGKYQVRVRLTDQATSAVHEAAANFTIH